jgi:hypothetical protein
MGLITGHPRYLDRAKAELIAVWLFPIGPATNFWSQRRPPSGAAVAYDWLYNRLTNSEPQLIAQAIVGKAIEPGFRQFAAVAAILDHNSNEPKRSSLKTGLQRRVDDCRTGDRGI